MRNRWYKTCVTDYNLFTSVLVLQVFSEVYDDDRMIFQVPLTRLGLYENYLDRDRFVFYSPVAQEHQITHDVSGDIMSWFEERLAWIRENVMGRWSFDLIMPTALDGRLTWSFSKASEAMLFKLTF